MAKGKGPVISITSRAEAQTILGEYAAESRKLKSLQNDLAGALTLSRSTFEPKIEEAETAIAARERALELWAEKSREEFEGKKSIDLLHGTLGFRLGNRTLKLRSKMSWERVLARLNGLRKYIRVKITREVNKEAILEDTKGDTPVLTNEKLVEMGVLVDQGESFYIDLKED